MMEENSEILHFNQANKQMETVRDALHDFLDARGLVDEARILEKSIQSLQTCIDANNINNPDMNAANVRTLSRITERLKYTFDTVKTIYSLSVSREDKDNRVKDVMEECIDNIQKNIGMVQGQHNIVASDSSNASIPNRWKNFVAKQKNKKFDNPDNWVVDEDAQKLFNARIEELQNRKRELFSSLGNNEVFQNDYGFREKMLELEGAFNKFLDAMEEHHKSLNFSSDGYSRVTRPDIKVADEFIDRIAVAFENLEQLFSEDKAALYIQTKATNEIKSLSEDLKKRADSLQKRTVEIQKSGGSFLA